MDLTWILDRKLAASSAPYDKNELLKWKKMGIKAVLNLLEDYEKYVSDDEYVKLGFDYLNFPIRDMDAPSLEDLGKVVKWIDEKIEEGKKVLVHCYAGLGRTGTVISAYLIYKFNFKPDEAVKFVRSKRPGSVQSFSQFVILEAFYRYLNGLSSK